jgi:hypothetical protein
MMQNSDFRFSKEVALKNANKHFRHDGPALDQAKLELLAARTASDANTLRLRNLRLARDEADQLAGRNRAK